MQRSVFSFLFIRLWRVCGKVQISGDNENYKTQIKASRFFLRSWWSLGANYEIRNSEFLPGNAPSTVKIGNSGYTLFVELSIPLRRGEK